MSHTLSSKFVVALVMEVAYGHTVRSSDDNYVQIVRQASTAVSDVGSPAAKLVDFFPALKFLPSWMPGGSFQKEAARVRILVRKLLDMPYDMVKSALAAGTAVPSLTSSLLEQAITEGKLTDEEEEDIKGTAGVLFGAGTDTTVTTLSVFFLTMVLHPEVYKKVQEEMDRVVGHSRLPDFDDRDSLPYLECVLKEVYRWNVPVPLGVPHQLMQDDEYCGYHIPGDTMVFPNIWAMSQDPKFYPDPERFRPERFEEMDANTAELRDPWHIVFGFGRRICPGRRFADEAIWIAIANIVATLNICKARDAHGEDVTPPLAFSGEFTKYVTLILLVRVLI
ncbi:Multifunctional cytochrome P450 monooxygenase af510 [Sparassis crispa]|uniref:Multifunctional cytochrome P450 monooxygenase af510 n=1 Tax=Sparassis crispa TaxID=139825 RepID=A0A401GJW0_9APHY|nr:Multifunctional cytochrome P450 monooxygenase af510 [Sparassis crispa]GBE82456.1 Multifunctional cytochrome P450 monooxygenase af510 [Sparassis crispa]